MSSFFRSLAAVSALLIVLALPLGALAFDFDNNDVPEFDLGTATAAFALLSGGLLVLKARKHRKAP